MYTFHKRNSFAFVRESGIKRRPIFLKLRAEKLFGSTMPNAISSSPLSPPKLKSEESP